MPLKGSPRRSSPPVCVRDAREERLVPLAGALLLTSAPAALATDARTVVGWGEQQPLGLPAGVGGVPTALTGVEERPPPPSARATFAVTPAGVKVAGSGQLGLGAPGYDIGFTTIPGTAGASAVATSHDATLIVRADGTVTGFGENASGAAGGTPGNAVASPTTIAGLSGVTAVAAGGAPYAGGGFSLALKADGTVWACGPGERARQHERGREQRQRDAESGRAASRRESDRDRRRGHPRPRGARRRQRLGLGERRVRREPARARRRPTATRRCR